MVDALRGLFVAMAWIIVMILSIALFCVALSGWFFLLRAHVLAVGGPRISDALPLDELPHHANLPVLVFLPLAMLASLGLGLVARFIGMNRLLAALTLASGVGVFFYIANVVSIYSVQQVTFDASLHNALLVKPMYVCAGLAGLAGALVGRRPARGEWMTSLIVYFVTLSGLLDLLSAVLPHATASMGFAQIAPGVLPPIAEASIVPAGALLIMSARGLARHNRVAWQVALIVSGTSAVVNIVHGSDLASAALAIFLVLCLLARRHDFTALSDPTARRPAVGRLVSVVAFAFLYALVVDIVDRARANQQVHFSKAVTAAFKALVGIGPPGGARLGDQFSEWYPWSVVAIVAIGIAWAVATWIGPWRHRPSDTDDTRELATQLVRRWGADTLSPFALREDKALFLHPDPSTSSELQRGETVVIAYRVIRGVAILTGDPIGPADQVATALAAFLELAGARGWKVTVVGASGRNLDLYRGQGMRAIYHGDEALVDVADFQLDRPAQRTVRQAVHRVERRGYTCSIVTAQALDGSLREELATVDEHWLAGKPRRGFVMQLDTLFRRRDEAIFVIGRSPEGRIDGFLHVCVCEASRTLSLSSMPRRDESPNGLNAWLINHAVEWARANGYVALSMNFAPFAKLLDPGVPCTGHRQLARLLLLRLKGVLALQLDNLLMFNRRFSPRWESRYLIYRHRRDLPRVILAALAAEGHLPFAARFRGWESDQLPESEILPLAGTRSH